MKSLLVPAITLAALGMAGPALAADFPLAPPLVAPAAPIYTWGGYYIGGNIGYSWGKADLAVTGFTVSGVSIPGADSAGLRPNGVVGGGQLGFNLQSGTVVFG